MSAAGSTTSKAFVRFQTTLARGDSLIALYKRLRMVRLNKEPTRFTHEDVADLLRSGLVLSVTAMDSYFTARFAELLVPFLKKHGLTDGLVKLLGEAGLDTRKALEMIKMDRPYRRIRTLMDSYLDRYTTQRAKVIDGLFLAYGIKNLSNNAQRSVKRRNLIRRVELMVERRHEIVHEGDLNDYGHLQKIDQKKIPGQIKDLRLFVVAAHTLTVRRMR